MKKLVRILAVLLLIFSSSAVFAQSGNSRWESIYEPGDFMLSASAGVAFPLAFTVYPGAEFMIYQLSDLPIDFGVAARGQFATSGSIFGYNYGYMSFGAGAFGTAHLSFNNLDNFVVPWLENFDFYVSLGLAFNYFTYTGIWTTATPAVRFGFASFEGVNWFFAENTALKLEYAYWGYFGSQATLGILFRL